VRTKHNGNRRYPVMTKHEGKMGRVEISLWSSHTILKDFKHCRSQISVYAFFVQSWARWCTSEECNLHLLFACAHVPCFLVWQSQVILKDFKHPVQCLASLC
jgi:hypothetical protein